jgi:hypothetical protein
MELGGMRDRLLPAGPSPRSRWLIGPPWFAAGALAIVLLAAVFLGVRLAESESRAERLRAELRGVYAEAESLRTSALQSQQRVALLEQQVRQLRTERETILRQLQAPALGKQRPLPDQKPTRKRVSRRP